jgi:hypothetical protein
MSAQVHVPVPPTVMAQVAVYCGAAGAPEDVMAVVLAGLETRAAGEMRSALRSFVEGKLFDFVVVARGDLPELRLVQNPQTGPDERKRFDEASHVVLLRASYAPSPPPLHHWALVAAAGAVAEATDGVVVDLLTRRMAPLDRRARKVPDDGRVTVVHDVLGPMSQRQDGTALVTTKGMTRFGLPELWLGQLPSAAGRDALALVNAVAQRLLHELYVRTQHVADHPVTELVRDEALVVDARDLAAAAGRPVPAGTPTRTAQVRLSYRAAEDGFEPFVVVDPPAAFQGDRAAWIHDAVGALVDAPN